MADVTELLQRAKDELALEKAKRYSPEMIVALRRAVIEAKIQSQVMADYAPTSAMRVNAEMQLEAWENHELSKL